MIREPDLTGTPAVGVPVSMAPARDRPLRLSVFGATGSIGASTLDLVSRSPEAFDVEVVAGGSNAQALAESARRVGARHAVIADPAALGALREALAGTRITSAAGETAVIEAAARPADMMVAAIVGAAGLRRRSRRPSRHHHCPCQQGMPRLRG